MKTYIYILLFILPYGLKAQTGIPVPPLASFDTKIRSFMTTYQVPGLSFALAKDGKILYMRSFGNANIDGTEPTQPHHVFRIASLSKQVTAVAIMKLMQEGKLTMDAKVFGPGGILENHPISASNIMDNRIYNITIQQLLEHSAGWNSSITCVPNPTPPYPYYFNGCDPIGFPLHVTQQLGVPNPVKENDLMRFLLEKGLNFNPGTAYAYSNIGYLVLGAIIEQSSGMSYEEYVQSAILWPLGIYDLNIGKNLLTEKLEREAEYVNNEGTNISIYGTGEPLPWTYGGMNVNAMDAHGGWTSSAGDLLKLLLAVDGFATKPDILSTATINVMTTPSTTNANYAKGWQVNTAGHWWHTGSLPGTFAEQVRTSTGYTWVVIMNKRYSSGSFASAVDNLGWNCISGIVNWPTADLALSPTQNATNITFSDVTTTSMRVSWINGNGGNRIVAIQEGSAVNAYPLDGTDYTGQANYATAPVLGGNARIAYTGNGNNVTITGLEPSKRYYIRVFEYNKTAAGGNNALYLLGHSAQANQLTAGVLPVRLITFDAVRHNDEVSLNWQTADEKDLSFYKIQRSSDGQSFEDVGSVQVKVNSSSANYSYTDLLDAGFANLPALYYRLKTADLDGRSGYSKVVKVQLDESGRVSLSPNPVRDVLQVRGNKMQHVKIQDTNGRIFFSKNYRSASQADINVSALAAGVYVVTITGSNGNKTNHRIIVNR